MPFTSANAREMGRLGANRRWAKYSSEQDRAAFGRWFADAKVRGYEARARAMAHELGNDDPSEEQIKEAARHLLAADLAKARLAASEALYDRAKGGR